MATTFSARRWYQFSLRELLIAMVAVAALAALFLKNRPYEPTPFITNFDARAELIDIGNERGLEWEPIQYGGGSTRGPGRNSLEQEFVYHRISAEELREKVMPTFRARIEHSLKDAGCHIEGRRASGKLEDSNQRWSKMRDFSFDYRRGKCRGAVRAYVFQSPSGNSELLILIDEW